MRAGIVLTAFLLLVSGTAVAQEQGAITGQVVEAVTMRPLANAQVFVDGTPIGGLTNADGRFRLMGVPPGQVVLRVQLIGYGGQRRTVSVAAGETSFENFEMRVTAIQLDELVVTGAGVATERRKLGNTIATIDVRALELAPVSSFSEVLTGREPGVVALPSGGVSGEGARFRIRGSASLSQSNEPVIYVDGVRVDRAGGFGTGLAAGGGGTPSRLDDINPDAIERIEILKGAAAATLFGTQASNGVIQIFTRRGQSGAPQYNISIEQGFSNYSTARLQPHAGFVLAETPSPRPSRSADIGTIGVRDYWGIDVEPYEVFEVDMLPRVLGTGHTQTYSLSVSGGAQAVTYYVGGRFHREDGPYDGKFLEAPGFRVANDEHERRNLNASVEMFPLPDLRIRLASSYAEMRHETPDNNNNIFGVFSSLLNSRPENATENNLFGSPTFATTRENFHRRTSQDVQRYGGALTAAYRVTPDIALDATVGLDYVSQRSVRMLPFGWNMDGLASANAAGWRGVLDRNHRELTLDVKGTHTAAFGADWTSQLVVGMQGFMNSTTTQRGEGDAFPGPGIEVAGAGELQTVFEHFSEEAQAGVFAQQQTGWRDFVFGTVGMRYDEHSAFGETAGGAFYPKASVSVIPSQLAGWNPERVSTFRVRGAVGRSGLQPTAFAKFTTFQPQPAETGPGLSPANLGNPDLRPETSVEWEAGTEIGVLQDRASLEFTYWNRTVTDALVDRQFAPSGGFEQPQLDNIGELKAWGLEVSSRFSAIRRATFGLDIFANASFLRERITDLGGAPPLKVFGPYPRYRQFTMEGFHPGSFFGPILDTSLQYPIAISDADAGYASCQPRSEAELLAYLSQPRDPGVIHPVVLDCGTGDMLMHYLGKPVPDWQGSFGATLDFLRSFSLTTMFEFRAGNYHVHDLDGAFRRSHFLIGRNVREAAEVEATLLNPASTAEERLAAANTWVHDLIGLSPYDGLNEIHPADWMRLREISLTYRVPRELAGRVGAGSLSITAAGRNLALWTKFPGRDPELNAWSRAGAEGGVDENFLDGTTSWGVPMQRRFTFAVRAGF